MELIYLPDFLKEKPEIIVCRYIIPPKMKLKPHHHDHMNFAIVFKGKLTVIKKDGQKKRVKVKTCLS